MFRVIVAGGRDFDDYELMDSKLKLYLSRYNKEKVVILFGMARGADRLAALWARNNGYKLEEHPADWSIGKKAGYIRNVEMADNSDALVAFWDGRSNGTGSMIKIMERRCFPVRIVKYGYWW